MCSVATHQPCPTTQRDKLRPVMNVTLDPVTSALWPALANLAQFYQYDFSEIENGIVNLAGRFTITDCP